MGKPVSHPSVSSGRERECGVQDCEVWSVGRGYVTYMHFRILAMINNPCSFRTYSYAVYDWSFCDGDPCASEDAVALDTAKTPWVQVSK